jgi:hypothetical protein
VGWLPPADHVLAFLPLRILKMKTLLLMLAVLSTNVWTGLAQDPPRADESVSRSAELSKRLFEIPAYPGTVPFNEYPQMKRFHHPFATSVLVYRTTDGGPLDKEKVIAFYQDHLTNKGWKDAIFKRRGDEAYLGLNVNLFESVKDGTRIQLSGSFYLWIAPQDGMYTILLDQWRLSSPGQDTLTFLHRIESSLDSIGIKSGYRVQKTYSDGEWEIHYQNEYLTDRRRFSFFANEASGPHARSDQSIDLIILTYRDRNTAEAEASLIRPSVPKLNDGRRDLPLPLSGINVVIVRNQTVLLIRDYSGTQAKAVKQIAAELEKL